MLKPSLKILLSLACIAAAGSATNATAPRPASPIASQSAVHAVAFEAIDNSGLFWDKQVPACDNQSVLDRIRAKFSYQVHNVPHLPDVAIVGFRNIRQRHYLPGMDISNTARRYCGATADLSNGKARTVYYMIVDEMGFASLGDGVQFCVQGFDRWRVYNGNCRLID